MPFIHLEDGDGGRQMPCHPSGVAHAKSRAGDQVKMIGRIVDEADVVQEVALEPVSPGLDAVCRGLRRISRDDHEAIERGFLIYDALFAELSQTESNV